MMRQLPSLIVRKINMKTVITVVFTVEGGENSSKAAEADIERHLNRMWINYDMYHVDYDIVDTDEIE